MFAFLILSSAGLAIVFGMMGVINMAHGGFIMCGAYVTVGLVNIGLPLPLAQLGGALEAGLVGVLIEITIIRRLYQRPADTLLATWGLSLVVTQGTLLVIGSMVQGIGTPPGSFVVGDYTFSTYRMILFGASIGVLALIYVVFMRTRFGTLARATMQHASMAQALGVRINWIYNAIAPIKPHLGEGYERVVRRLRQAIDARYDLPRWDRGSYEAHKLADLRAGASETTLAVRRKARATRAHAQGGRNGRFRHGRRWVVSDPASARSRPVPSKHFVRCSLVPN